MSHSLNTTSAETFQSYVQDFSDQLITKMFFGFLSSKDCTPHEGVKGKLALPQLVIADLIRRYGETFTVVQNAFTFGQRNLEVFDAKIDLRIVPKQFESSWMGKFRQQGQDSYDLPFEGEILDQATKKANTEMEIAFWQAVAAAVPAPTDKLVALFDGLREIIKDEVANLNPVTTGVLTNLNAFSSIEALFKTVGSQYQTAGIDLFISPMDNILAGEEYREKYGKYTTPDRNWGLPMLNVKVKPGIPKNCLIMTPKENIHYGYDGELDHEFFNFEKDDRSIKIWADFKMGVNFGLIHPELMAINEQWAV